MLRFITCEDNKEATDKVIRAVRKIMMPYDFDYKISTFQSYNDELKEIIRSTSEQKVYLLDVELPTVSGLEIATEIREIGDWESMILFVSAHPECRDDIFFSRIMALDFISKYYSYERRLENSLKKVLDIYNNKPVLVFSYDYITYRIPQDKILYIEKSTSDKKCIIVVESGKKYEVTTSLKELMPKLSIYFYRTHKSCVVNTKQISEVDYLESSITFNNKVKTDLLSNRCKKGLKEYLENY